MNTCEMNYTPLTYSVVLDFLEFEIRTFARHPAWRIHKAMNGVFSFVAGHDEITGIEFPKDKKNTPTNIFRCRIQDPRSYMWAKTDSKPQKLLTIIEEVLDIQSPPTLTVAEIAFDTYCTDASVHQLAEIAADRYRFSTRVPARDWHFYRRKGEKPHYLDGRNCPDGEMTRREIAQHFADDYQLTDISDKLADVRCHVYVKKHDGKNVDGEDNDGQSKPPKLLKPHEWRARFEVTLRGAALPCKTLEELDHIDFSKLVHYFQFRRLASDLHPAAKYALTQWSGRQLGRRGEYRRKHRNIIGAYRDTDHNKFRSSTEADQINREILEQLRTLTRHWRSKRNLSHNKTRADFSEHSEAQTPVNAEESGAVLIIGFNNRF